MLHDEVDAVAAFAAAETFIYFLAGRYRERRRFFIVKGAEAKVAVAALLQFHEGAYHVDDVDAGEDLLYGVLCDQVWKVNCKLTECPSFKNCLN